MTYFHTEGSTGQWVEVDVSFVEEPDLLWSQRKLQQFIELCAGQRNSFFGAWGVGECSRDLSNQLDSFTKRVRSLLFVYSKSGGANAH